VVVSLMARTLFYLHGPVCQAVWGCGRENYHNKSMGGRKGIIKYFIAFFFPSSITRFHFYLRH
jgi:hypothetical protein